MLRERWTNWRAKLECGCVFDITPREYDALELGDAIVCPEVASHGVQELRRLSRGGSK